MKTILITGFVFTFCVFCSCENESSSGVNTSVNNNFEFLKEGNQWNYKYSIEGGSSTSYVQEITGKDNNGYYLIKTTLESFSHTEFRWEATNDYFADFPGFPLFYKNGSVGKKWSASEPDEDLGSITREILSVSETVTVPAGTFNNCQKVKQSFADDPAIIYYYWISPQNGLVKQESTGWEEDDEDRTYFNVSMELQSKNF